MNSAVSEADLTGYIDDQLDVVQRLAVEEYLAANPHLAAQVMADLRTRDALRLLLRTPMRAAEGPTISAAGRLKHKFVRRCVVDRLRKIAAVGFFIGIGWFSHADGVITHNGEQQVSRGAPAFVEDAIIAHRIDEAGTRTDMQSHYPIDDSATIEAGINIRLPPLPVDWAVNDVRILPSHEGSGIEESISAASLGRVSVFAVHSEADLVQPPAAVSDGVETTIYWQSGHQAMALTGNGSAGILRHMGWVLFGESVNSTN